MVFLRILPGSQRSRSPSCALNNCIIPSKHVKTLNQGSSVEFSCFTPRDCKRPQWNKPFLNMSIFPCCLESRCTEKNQARSFMTSTHASVRCSILARVHKTKSMQHHTFGSGTAEFQVTWLPEAHIRWKMYEHGLSIERPSRRMKNNS